MEDTSYSVKIKVAQRMILEYEKKLKSAIELEDWQTAGRFDAILFGMRQIMVVFELGELVQERGKV